MLKSNKRKKITNFFNQINKKRMTQDRMEVFLDLLVSVYYVDVF